MAKYENVPIVPRMSGSGRPESISPLGTFSGGYVTGTVRIDERTPAAPAVTQNDVPPRIDSIFGRWRGIQSNRNFAGVRFTIPRSGR